MTQSSEKKFLHRITSQLKARQPIRENLPFDGMLNIDQPVPFLIAYRIPPHGKDDFTYQLGKTESSYLTINKDSTDFVQSLLRAIIHQVSDMFGAFLLLEVWIGQGKESDDFTVHINHKSAEPIAATLQKELSKSIGVRRLTANINTSDRIAPPYYTPFIEYAEAKKSGTLLMGLEIRPGYLNASGEPYPLYTRELRNVLGKALKKSFYEFVRLHTSFIASHFQMLGTTVLEDLVWKIDQELALCSSKFDFLFLITPVNTDEAWKDFEKSGFQKPPVFHYRHMPIDPELVKRKLYDLPIEEIADPTIAFLFRDKRKEIDRMLTMLIDREKPDFIQSSIQLFGKIDENLIEIAKALLVATAGSKGRTKEYMQLDEFISVAREELQYLKDQYGEVKTDIMVRDDIEGIMVSRGVLCINNKFRVERSRAEALVQHEVGTHIATYFNGFAQPFKLFYIGVPGYEQLQEGLAVFAEFLCGGLNSSRLRTLAARVIAVQQMVTGHTFIDTFFLLSEKYQFSKEHAFSITMRAYRGGGLTKDAIYLKGLISLLEYVKAGHDITPLLMGKIRQDYLPIIDELIYRKLLKPIPIKPRYLHKYLESVKKMESKLTVFNLTQACE
ncbi:MAG TPA: tyrosine/phenylalanine carboxypeptidase domain-containing protein [Cyclobacteriaceae bacterium]|nr:tyrosine/phenylalanine carboxypeptidase domain-containing protein [Cyclobacteriaceae bacterium]